MQYIIITAKYLIKKTKAKAMKKEDIKKISIYLYKNIIAHFGCPKIFISDNGSHF